MNTDLTAQRWFGSGERVPYDHHGKKILLPGEAKDSSEVLHVFQRLVSSGASNDEGVWTTFLPGFPDGSFGWARVDRYLTSDGLVPKMFVEYIGQGDSDKPADYPYGTMERADLVESLWQAHGIKSTFVVTFDYSSLVALELLSRQQERLDSGSKLVTRIERVLIINGGLFADAHSHPWLTTPLLKTPMGKVGTWVAQRSKFAFNQMMKGLWSKDYNVTSAELAELYEAISRRNGAAFMSNAAGFVYEHKAHAERWDLRRVFLASGEFVSFHIVGSEGDPFEPNQLVKARERLGDYGLDIRVLPGGHMTTSEHPNLLAEIIQELGRNHNG
ncbi:MAG: alpha/beta hydrolase [Planctomycetes bacterium]|nr:alpha/beta hydrolase [Planctomycetota bacterium]